MVEIDIIKQLPNFTVFLIISRNSKKRVWDRYRLNLIHIQGYIGKMTKASQGGGVNFCTKKLDAINYRILNYISCIQTQNQDFSYSGSGLAALDQYRKLASSRNIQISIKFASSMNFHINAIRGRSVDRIHKP